MTSAASRILVVYTEERQETKAYILDGPIVSRYITRLPEPLTVTKRNNKPVIRNKNNEEDSWKVRSSIGEADSERLETCSECNRPETRAGVNEGGGSFTN